MATPLRTLAATARPPTCATCGYPTASRARQVESIAHCTNCGEDVCWLDGISLVSHPRCAACQILVGSSHASTKLHEGLCDSCSRWQAKARDYAEKPFEERLAYRD